jgi:hypothetical protein
MPGHRLFSRFTPGQDATVIAALKAELARGLIFRTVIPSLRRLVTGEFKDDDVLAFGPFQDFGMPMNGEHGSQVLAKTRRIYFSLFFRFGFVASLLTNNCSVFRHVALLRRIFRFGPLFCASCACPPLDTTNLTPEQAPPNFPS